MSSPDNPITFGSLFTGVGGFDLAFERAGMTCAWQVENDKYPVRVLEERWPDVKRWTDVSEFDPPDEPTVIAGGFPCQDISVAGRRAGLAGSRSGLWWEFHRVLHQARSQWAVIENVPGLLSSNRGRDLGAILGALGDLGYGFAYRVLDAQHFGVPQRRRRLFIVGCLGDPAGAGEVLLEPEGGAGRAGAGGEAGAEAAAGAAGGAVGVAANQRGEARIIRGGVVGAIQANGSAKQFNGVMVEAASVTMRGRADGQELELGEPGVANVLRTGTGGSSKPSVLTPDLRVRKLTPVECERLQGFPDGWTEGLSDTRRYKAMGNAVAVPVVEWIGRRIVSYEQTGRAW